MSPIQVTGMNELKKSLNQLAKALSPILEEAVLEAARTVEAEAKTLAPVDEGTLRDSIVSELRLSDATQASVEVGPTVDYAISVEFGTNDTPAQAFLRPAVDAKEEEAVRKIASILEKQLDRGL